MGSVDSCFGVLVRKLASPKLYWEHFLTFIIVLIYAGPAATRHADRSLGV